MPGAQSAEKQAYADKHEFREYRATLQMDSTAVLQRSHSMYLILNYHIR